VIAPERPRAAEFSRRRRGASARVCGCAGPSKRARFWCASRRNGSASEGRCVREDHLELRALDPLRGIGDERERALVGVDRFGRATWAQVSVRRRLEVECALRAVDRRVALVRSDDGEQLALGRAEVAGHRVAQRGARA